MTQTILKRPIYDAKLQTHIDHFLRTLASGSDTIEVWSVEKLLRTCSELLTAYESQLDCVSSCCTGPEAPAIMAMNHATVRKNSFDHIVFLKDEYIALALEA